MYSSTDYEDDPDNPRNDPFRITLVDVDATFTDKSEDVPEVELTYANSAATGTGSYSLQFMDPSCSVVDNTNVIFNLDGSLPDTQGSNVHAMVNIDTTRISETAYFDGSSDSATGKISFCVIMEYFDQRSQMVTSETSKITLQLDQTARWEVAGLPGLSKSPGERVDYVSFDYSTEAFFCNDYNQEVTLPPLYPGQSVQVCVRTPPGSEVEVADLRSVVFKNELVSV